MTTRHNPRSVAVGIDGSPSALRAVGWAAGVAVRDGVPLRLVHTYGLASGFPTGVAQQESLLMGLRAQGQRWVDEAREVAAEVDPALPVEVVLAVLPVAEALLRESATASMLVLGTRRLSAFAGLLVGSTSVAVAGRAACPVVIVRGSDPEEVPRVTGPVVVGVDATVVSDSAIAFAFAEALVRKAEVVAVYAWTESVFGTAPAAGRGQSDLATCRQEARDVLAARLAGWLEKYPDVPVRQEVVHDRPGRALSHHSHSAQLVVVGRRGRDAFQSLVLGSTSQYLLHHARCPVAVTTASPSVPPSASPPTSVVVPTPSGAQPSTGSRTPTPTPHVLNDGRHAAYLTAIDVPGRTISFDVIQFLTGAAADEAFHQDHPEFEGGPPNGYYIRNESSRLRTLPVRTDVPVQVVWLGEGAQLESISFEELPAYVAADLEPDDHYLWYDPFWLTVHGDRVESIVEQYIP